MFWRARILPHSPIHLQSPVAARSLTGTRVDTAPFTAPEAALAGKGAPASPGLRNLKKTMSMNTVLRLNAVIGLVSTMTAAGMIWLSLTRPAEVASAVANRDYGTIVMAIASQLGDWMHALLRFL